MLAETNLSNWRQATKAAHQALAHQAHTEALQHFLTAVHEAEQLLLHRAEDLPTPRIYGFTCQCLVNCYRRLGQMEQAFSTVQRAYWRLVDIIEDPCLPEVLRRNGLAELRHHLVPALNFLQQWPEGVVESQRLLNHAHTLTVRRFGVAPAPNVTRH
ncbi:hypothetical protein CAI21_13725 [Alkalilimnicola ehrlichii]|uniref:Uncharacterized protein n=1 Tax=Alkalilimnicola ehrlichii TaxID=351052 RepID=A0A3E0WNR9_9GAMM|nr:hypothetical protein [Alkalilimnicola ehrlichii]RFA27973.1 hypothetical protein CAI21_13725 [Alkalilimnicola ehrlichii]RFA34620.1 hypothetical protein CAL65_14750 [Alkalilimnicola ehrlichii]